LDQRLLNISFPGEPVAYAVDRNDVCRISRVILDLVSDIFYMRIYAAFIPFELIAKCPFNKVFPSENLAGRRCKAVEYLEFCWSDSAFHFSHFPRPSITRLAIKLISKPPTPGPLTQP
jgi:hypothetical protein